MLELAGRGAIVAGTRRIGAAIVRRLAREGVRVAIVYRSSQAEAEALLQEALTMTDRGCVIQADLSDEGQVERVIETAKRELGDLSFSINLAYDYPRDRLETLSAASWDRGMLGAKANFLVAVHAARAIAQNEGETKGHLVFFGDWASDETPYDDYLPYLTGKAAVHFMTRAFARELADQGILVNCIAPGPMALGIGLSEAAWEKAISFTPLKRQASDEDAAEMVAALLRMETITGEVIRVDSGRHVVGAPLRE